MRMRSKQAVFRSKLQEETSRRFGFMTRSSHGKASCSGSSLKLLLLS